MAFFVSSLLLAGVASAAHLERHPIPGGGLPTLAGVAIHGSSRSDGSGELSALDGEVRQLSQWYPATGIALDPGVAASLARRAGIGPVDVPSTHLVTVHGHTAFQIETRPAPGVSLQGLIWTCPESRRDFVLWFVGPSHTTSALVADGARLSDCHGTLEHDDLPVSLDPVPSGWTLVGTTPEGVDYESPTGRIHLRRSAPIEARSCKSISDRVTGDVLDEWRMAFWRRESPRDPAPGECLVDSRATLRGELGSGSVRFQSWSCPSLDTSAPAEGVVAVIFSAGETPFMDPRPLVPCP